MPDDKEYINAQLDVITKVFNDKMEEVLERCNKVLKHSDKVLKYNYEIFKHCQDEERCPKCGGQLITVEDKDA